MFWVIIDCSVWVVVWVFFYVYINLIFVFVNNKFVCGLIESVCWCLEGVK